MADVAWLVLAVVAALVLAIAWIARERRVVRRWRRRGRGDD